MRRIYICLHKRNVGRSTDIGKGIAPSPMLARSTARKMVLEGQVKTQRLQRRRSSPWAGSSQPKKDKTGATYTFHISRHLHPSALRLRCAAGKKCKRNFYTLPGGGSRVERMTLGGVFQLQDMGNVNRNCIPLSDLCFGPPPTPLSSLQRGEVNNRHFPPSAICHLPSAPIIPLVLVQEAAFETLGTPWSPRLPRPYSPVWESGPGQAAAPQTSDDIVRPEAGEKGVFCPPRQILGL